MKKNKPKSKVKKTYVKYKIPKSVKNEKDKIYIERSIQNKYLKKTLNRDKDAWQEIKGNKYVNEQNKIRRLFPEEMKLQIQKTKGSKHEGEKHCSTKSQWKWKQEELEKEEKTIPEIKLVEKEYERKVFGIDEGKEKAKKELEYKEFEEIIMLISEKSLGIYMGKVKKFSKDPFVATVWKTERPKKRIKCVLERWKMEEDPEKIIETPVGERKIYEIIKISISTSVGIYKIIRIEE